MIGVVIKRLLTNNSSSLNPEKGPIEKEKERQRLHCKISQ
jgi:hypothetical protein